MDSPEELAPYGIQDEWQAKQKHNTLCVGDHYYQANTINVNNPPTNNWR